MSQRRRVPYRERLASNRNGLIVRAHDAANPETGFAPTDLPGGPSHETLEGVRAGLGVPSGVPVGSRDAQLGPSPKALLNTGLCHLKSQREAACGNKMATVTRRESTEATRRWRVWALADSGGEVCQQVVEDEAFLLDHGAAFDHQ
jgi:hypothetical protein